MKEKIIAIFDIGKTNKKLLLFDYGLNCLEETERKFDAVKDDDDFECDDIVKIEQWIKDSIVKIIRSDKYDLTAVNFATYGATVAYLGEEGERLTPVYNYLKPVAEKIPERIYKRYGGQDEFCRRTASPALGMLNSGMQVYWLKSIKPEIFRKVRHILHFPQYLSYLLTGKVYSEHTSIGCHTALWDFDKMEYHPWVNNEGFNLPPPSPVDTMNEVTLEGKKFMAGIGIHDSSSSLAPYFGSSNGKFILVSTGTWCINMNPFNDEKLTSEQLDRDCLCYMSINRQPVKSSRLFLGHMHETGIKMLADHFKVPSEAYKGLKPDIGIEDGLKEKFGSDKIFFNPEAGSREFNDNIDLFEFTTFNEGYRKLMNELGELTVEAIKLVIAENDDTENLYITGGFSGNELFTDYLSKAFPSKNTYTSVLKNATALGAALVVLEKISPEKHVSLNLGLKSC
jgi:sugar (pentulose or hexulose) kinase